MGHFTYFDYNTIKYFASFNDVIPIIWSKGGIISKWCNIFINDLVSFNFINTDMITMHILDYEDEYSCILDGSIIIHDEYNNGRNEEFCKYIQKMNGVILFNVADEEFVFQNFDAIKHSTFNWRQTYNKNKEHLYNETTYVPWGYRDKTFEAIDKKYINYNNRTLSWSFMGNTRDKNRLDMCDNLQYIGKNEILKTLTYGSGYNVDDYFKILCSSMIAPCPSGHVSNDALRFFEAMEAGCLPIIEKKHFISEYDTNNWYKLFDDPVLPFVMVDDWTDGKKQIEELLNDKFLLMKKRNLSIAYWCIHKYILSAKLLNQIKYIKNLNILNNNDKIDDIYSCNYINRKQNLNINTLVTIIITTSFLKTHPDTSLIIDVVDSIKKYSELKYSNIIITCDGCKFDDQKNIYEEYKTNLIDLTLHNNNFKNILLIFNDENIGQANCIKKAFKYVETEQILMVEHDCVLQPNLDLNGIINVIHKYPNKYKHINLSHEKSIYDENGEKFSFANCGTDIEYIDGVPLLKTLSWSMRPHFALTKYYKNFILNFFSDESYAYLENIIYPIEINRCILDSKNHDDFGTYVYCPSPGKMLGHIHYDKRGNVPKNIDIYKYINNDVPIGAPQ